MSGGLQRFKENVKNILKSFQLCVMINGQFGV